LSKWHRNAPVILDPLGVFNEVQTSTTAGVEAKGPQDGGVIEKVKMGYLFFLLAATWIDCEAGRFQQVLFGAVRDSLLNTQL
jgi:hypothetical protein